MEGDMSRSKALHVSARVLVVVDVLVEVSRALVLASPIELVIGASLGEAVEVVIVV
jgi:hypothetical protein